MKYVYSLAVMLFMAGVSSCVVLFQSQLLVLRIAADVVPRDQRGTPRSRVRTFHARVHKHCWIAATVCSSSRTTLRRTPSTHRSGQYYILYYLPFVTLSLFQLWKEAPHPPAPAGSLALVP